MDGVAYAAVRAGDVVMMLFLVLVPSNTVGMHNPLDKVSISKLLKHTVQRHFVDAFLRVYVELIYRARHVKARKHLQHEHPFFGTA
jgi:hypothetical protein